MGSKPQAPAAADPNVTIPAQTKSNIDTASASSSLNAVNQVSPFGNVTYDKTGEDMIGGNAVPRWTQTTTLSPAEQQKLDQTNALTGQALTTAGKGLSNAQQTLSSPFNLDGVTPLPGVNDFSADRQRVTDALMGRFNQDFPKQQEDVISRMNAEGIQRGSAGYDNAMDTLNRSQVDAKNAAIAAGGAEQSRLFGLAGQAHQQGVADAALIRNQPINEFATLLGLGGQVQAPTGAPNFGINVGNTDVLGAYGLQQQGLMNAYNQKMGANNAMWGALGNVAGAAGGAAIMKSDRRHKNIIRRAGRTPRGIPLYLYKFKGEDRPMIGVMAQEVRTIDPLAVHDLNGVLHVDYARVA